MVRSREVTADVTRAHDERYVYIYADEGSSEASVTGWRDTLIDVMKYAPKMIKLTYAKSLMKDLTTHGAEKTVIIFPGGADIPFMRRLQGDAIEQIRAIVASGASYIGTCAGAYFASTLCVFEANDESLRIVERRPLSLLDRPAFGATGVGFKYGSENGASIATLQCRWKGEEFKAEVYINGGPAWANVIDENGTIVIARFCSAVLCRHGISEKKPAAVIRCSFGLGVVVLSGVHPELRATNDANGSALKLIRAICNAARL